MKGKKWKILYGLFLGVVSCLLYNTLFTLKNASAAVIETNALTSGWINCDENANDVIWYSSTGNIRSKCSRWTELTTKTGPFNIYRLEIPFNNTNNEYKFTDKDGYALVTFSLAALGTNNILPTNFIGRNVNIIETQVDYEPIYAIIRGKGVDGSNSTIGNAISMETDGNSYFRAIYTMKIRIPKNVIWNGKLDIQTDLSFPDSGNNTFQLFLSSVRFGWIYEPNADIAAEAQQNQEDRDNIESQSQETNSDASSSEQQISSGTSSLISVVTSFSNAMIGVRRTNCKLPRMTAYNFDLGELDLCTYSPPAWIQTITSAVVSLIVVRLAYKIFKRIMGIAKGISK